jgi:hypothetical protein
MQLLCQLILPDGTRGRAEKRKFLLKESRAGEDEPGEFAAGQT